MYQIMAKKIVIKNKIFKFNYRKKLYYLRSVQILRKIRRRILRYIAIVVVFFDFMLVRIDEVFYVWNVIMCWLYVLICFNFCVGI